MGCDIHLHAEIKVNGQWHHYSKPSIDRNYSLFAKMAGVRGDEEPLAEPRGFPDDATFTTRFDFEHWGRDAHTPSWLSGDELQAVCDFYEADAKTYGDPKRFICAEMDQFGFLFGNGWKLRPGDGHPANVEDVRWVFWFDN
jgi:hypothetical protein